MTVQTRAADRDGIEVLFARLNKAHADKDPDAIVEAYAEDAVICDLAPPLSRRGIKRDEVAGWLATWDGPITIATRDLDLAIEGAMAFATALTRMRGSQGGVEQDIWFRTTLCLRRSGEDWRIVHEHTSVPFYMDGSYRAAVDLAPAE